MHTFVKNAGAKERMKTKLFLKISKNPAALEKQQKGAEERLKTKLFNF